MSEQAPPPDLKSRIKASYDAIAPKYNQWTLPHSTKKLHYLSLLLNHLPPSPALISVLELGCGNGLPVTRTLLTRPNIAVTANDLSPTQLSLARTNLQDESISGIGRLKLIESDMLTLNFEAGSFDAVVAMYSLIHLPRAEQVTMLTKIFSWLKPGGYLLANFGVKEMEGAEVEKWLEEDKGWMFWSGWGREGTLEKVRDVGLEVVLQETVTDDDDEDAVQFLWILARKKEV